MTDAVKEGTVCFWMRGEDFTNLVRRFWADEQEPERALRLVLEGISGMPFEDGLCILTGRKKLVGDSRKGLRLVKDRAKKSPCGNDLSIEAVIGSFRTQVHRLEKDQQAVITEFRRTEAKIAAELEEQQILDEWVEQQNELDTREPPKPIRKIDGDFGWLSPDGKFYGCGWMEHIWLAGALGYEERQMEDLGWIKIEKGEAFRPGGFRQDLEATQSQIDLIFDWYTKREKELPYWLLKDET